MTILNLPRNIQFLYYPDNGCLVRKQSPERILTVIPLQDVARIHTVRYTNTEVDIELIFTDGGDRSMFVGSNFTDEQFAAVETFFIEAFLDSRKFLLPSQGIAL